MTAHHATQRDCLDAVADFGNETIDDVDVSDRRLIRIAVVVVHPRVADQEILYVAHGRAILFKNKVTVPNPGATTNWFRRILGFRKKNE